MKDSFYWKGLRLWIEGLLLLSLRWAQLRSGFDPETGLSLPSVPGMVLIAAILFLAAAEAVLCLRLPKGKRTYGCCIAPIGQKPLPFLAAGSLLLGVGGVLLPGWSTLSIAAAAAGIAAALGILLFTQQTRSGADTRVIPLLPSMLFSVLFLLSLYLPEGSNPVLARYYLPVLAAALIASAFYQLAGLTCREGKLGGFVFFGDLAVPLSLAALAEGTGNWGQSLVFAGCALILTVFLALRRAEPLPEPEPEEPEGQDAEPEQA